GVGEEGLCPPPFAPGRCSYNKNQSHPRPVGAPAPGAKGGCMGRGLCRTRSHRGRCSYNKTNPTPNRRSTRPGCEGVPDPFAPRRCSYNKTNPTPTRRSTRPGCEGGAPGTKEA